MPVPNKDISRSAYDVAEVTLNLRCTTGFDYPSENESVRQHPTRLNYSYGRALLFSVALRSYGLVERRSSRTTGSFW
jgi:hypothetical protein